MSDRCQKPNMIPVSAGIPPQMLTKNTLSILVVMVLPVGEENTKRTHRRADEKTMRTLETSKQTNVPVCKYPVIAIFQLNWASAETESTGIQLILCDLDVLDRKLMVSPSRIFPFTTRVSESYILNSILFCFLLWEGFYPIDSEKKTVAFCVVHLASRLNVNAVRVKQTDRGARHQLL